MLASSTQMVRLIPSRLLLLIVSLRCASLAADSLMRREGEGPLPDALVESGGKVQVHEHLNYDMHREGITTHADRIGSILSETSRTLSTPTGSIYDGLSTVTIPSTSLGTCEDFHINSADHDGSDVCQNGQQSWSSSLCRNATDPHHLNLTLGSPFILSTDHTNPLPYPKACFLNTSENKVYFNPSGSDVGDLTLTGRKICMRPLYVNGQANTDSPAACTWAGADYVPILEYDACLYAMAACEGGGAPKLDQFFYNVSPANYKPQNKPRGCFKVTSTGQWAFNWIHKEAGTVDANLTGADATPQCYDSTANSAAPTGA